MNQKELTKTFMMISNWKNPLACTVFIKNISGFMAKIYIVYWSCRQGRVSLNMYFTLMAWRQGVCSASFIGCNRSSPHCEITRQGSSVCCHSTLLHLPSVLRSWRQNHVTLWSAVFMSNVLTSEMSYWRRFSKKTHKIWDKKYIYYFTYSKDG